MRVGIDLGSANIRAAVSGRDTIFHEPSLLAVDKSKKVLAIGEKARELLSKTSGEAIAVYPLKDGVMADYDATEILLNYMLKKAGGKLRFFKPSVVMSVPAKITTIEERALKEAVLSAGAKEVSLFSVPFLAAVGADLPVEKPQGHMVIDIGAGTTEIGILSFGKIVHSTSLRTGGNSIDSIVVRYVRKVYNLIIGKYTAEQIKKDIGSAVPLDNSLSLEVKGRDLISSLPKSVTLTDEEIREPLEEFFSVIFDEIKVFLEKTPPELVGDVIDNGILLTGGGSLFRGLEDRLRKEIGVSIYIPEDSVESVVKGTLAVKI